MDVIINNPAPTATLPAQGFTPGYGPVYPSGGYAGYGPHWSHGGGSPFLGILFIVGAVLLVRFALRRAAFRRGWGGPRWAAARPETQGTAEPSFRPRWPFGGPEDSAMQIARERFARGELTAEEFDTIRRGLTGSAPDSAGA